MMYDKATLNHMFKFYGNDLFRLVDYHDNQERVFEILGMIRRMRAISAQTLIGELIVASIRHNELRDTTATYDPATGEYVISIPSLLTDSAVPKPNFATAIAWACGHTNGLRDPRNSPIFYPFIGRSLRAHGFSVSHGAASVKKYLNEQTGNKSNYGLPYATRYMDGARNALSTYEALEACFMAAIMPHPAVHGIESGYALNQLMKALVSLNRVEGGQDSLLHSLAVNLHISEKQHHPYTFGLVGSSFSDSFPLTGPFVPVQENGLAWPYYQGFYMRLTDFDAADAWSDSYYNAQSEMYSFLQGIHYKGANYFHSTRVLSDFIKETTEHRIKVIEDYGTALRETGVSRGELNASIATVFNKLPIMQALNQMRGRR